MNKHLVSLAVLAFALSGTAFAAMDKDQYKAEKDKIEATAKADKKACDAMKANAKDICMAEAKGKEKVAKAELEVQYKPGPKADEKAKIAKADATYAVAKEKCDDLQGQAKDSCKKEAKMAHDSAKGSAKAAKAAETKKS